ncbi:MAG: hypothetical protein M3O85_02700, partial [Acidobacteriota bacterium]|nr:hypothetical protein [Acidobacteriota bacterium]
AMSVTSQTSDPANFEEASFSGSPSGANMTGGSDSAGTPSLTKPFATFYSYDPMDNLTQVSQGAQTRTYVYNGLSRLASAATPESGTVGYTYTDAGTVYQRTDARNIVTTYGYDGLNRLAGVSYSDSTPAAGFTYTGARLTSMTDGSGSETYTYDGLGRISNLAKVINATTYNIGYGYNLASELTSLTYPSGRVVSQSYDAVGHLTQIADNVTYLSGMTYNSASLPTGFNYGNGVAASFGYNTRLELQSLSYVKGANTLLSLTYAYGTGNNGQIATITDNVDSSKSMTYTYDALARLQYATAGPTGTPTWKLGFVYDRYGNRTQQNLLAGTGFATQTPTDPVTNRLLSPNVYDSSGNLTNDTLHTYTYDAENRMTAADAGATAAYTYIGALRVKKVASGTTTVYIFNGSKVIAEYVNGAAPAQPTKEYVYAGNKLLATLAGGAVTYQHPDHLSTRVETDASGASARTFGQYPFGETWYETGTANKWKFTSYERDAESALDYAVFRSYSSRLGRFMQPDLVAGRILNPQSLNRYTYVLNDPVGLLDPLGLDPPLCPSCPQVPGDSITVTATVTPVPTVGSQITWQIGLSNIGGFANSGNHKGMLQDGTEGSEAGKNSKDPTTLPKCSDVFWDALKQPLQLINKGMKSLPAAAAALAGGAWGVRWIAAQSWAMEAAGAVDPVGGAAYWQAAADSTEAAAAGARAAAARAPTVALGALDAALAYAVAKEAYAAATGKCKP